MKFNGQALDLRATATVRIPRPDRVLTVLIRSFPLGYDVDDYVTLPEQPLEPKRDKSGEILRTADGAPQLLPAKPSQWVREFDRAVQLQLVADLYFATRDAGQFSWEAEEKLSPEKDGDAFFAALFEELQAAGFTPGDVRQVSQRARKLSLMAPGDVEAYMADFSQAGPSHGEHSETDAAHSTK